MKNLIDVSHNVLHIEYNSREFDAREYPRGRDGNETKIKFVRSEEKKKKKKKRKKRNAETSSGRINALVTRYQLLSRACLIQRFNCAFNLFQKGRFCSVIERARETIAGNGRLLDSVASL